MAEIDNSKRPLEAGEDVSNIARKKPKLSDLPLSQVQRSAIESLVDTFRRKGEYDAIKSLVRTQYESDVSFIHHRTL